MTWIHNGVMLNDNYPKHLQQIPPPPTLFFIVITVLPLRKMAVTNSLKYYSFFPLLLFFLRFILTENILNHVSLYTVHAQRNKSELIMRGPSLRKYKRQLWSRMACNSLPDPIPNLLIRCFFFLSLALLCSNLPAELTQMGTCCPIKDTFKAKHVIHFILQEEGMWGWECCLVRDEPRKLCLFRSVGDNFWDLWSQLLSQFVSDRAAWQMRMAVIADRVSSPGCKSI